MNTKDTKPRGTGSARAATATIKAALRDVRIQLVLLNHQIGGRLALRDVDLDCLDVLAKDGPLTPSALARRCGLHPATLTGILDRLERGGWIARDRGPSDRRSITVRALTDRSVEIYRLYRGMNKGMDEVCAGYSSEELELISGFLQRTAEAGRQASGALSEQPEQKRAQES